jgi:hypothetical protein
MGRGARTGAVDEVVDELYGVDPGEFVAARNELAGRLRKAGDREQAAEVAKLRRPSPAAWAVNQLARHHRAELEELVRLGEALRSAQDKALAGEEQADLRQAGRARRDALARLSEQAERILAGRGGAPGTHANEVGATLEAASMDAEAAAAVLAGRLSSELRPPSGFGAFDLPVAAPRAKAEPASPDEPGPTRPSPQLKEAEEAAAEAKRRWEERSGQARAAVGGVAERRRAAHEAESEVARLEDLLDEAQRRLRKAVRDAELAEDAASRAEEAAAKAGERLRQADARLAEMEGSG